MDAPQGKSYDGPSGIGRDSFWLTAEDLIEGADVTVKIEDVKIYPKVTFQGGRERLNMLGLKFAGKQRILGLNATNRKVLNRMFGNITSAWKGESIVLYVADTMMAGETVKCVRIRDRGSRVATAAEQFLSGDEEAAPEVELGGDTKLDEACRALGMTAKAKAKLLAEHGGDMEAALKELNARADGQ